MENEKAGSFAIINSKAAIKRKDIKTMFIMLEEIQKQNDEILKRLSVNDIVETVPEPEITLQEVAEPDEEPITDNEDNE